MLIKQNKRKPELCLQTPFLPLQDLFLPVPRVSGSLSWLLSDLSPAEQHKTSLLFTRVHLYGSGVQNLQPHWRRCTSDKSAVVSLIWQPACWKGPKMEQTICYLHQMTVRLSRFSKS